MTERKARQRRPEMRNGREPFTVHPGTGFVPYPDRPGGVVHVKLSVGGTEPSHAVVEIIDSSYSNVLNAFQQETSAIFGQHDPRVFLVKVERQHVGQSDIRTYSAQIQLTVDGSQEMWLATAKRDNPYDALGFAYLEGVSNYLKNE